MPVHIALLRAVNVGGTGKLPMAELRAICERAGFRDVRTYIQTGNVVFSSPLSQLKARDALVKALTPVLGAKCGVLLRSVAELEAIVARNPFPDAAPNQLLVLFLDDAPPRDVLEACVIPGRERIELHGRELFIHFPEGMGRSKLKIPYAGHGTGRNLNTVRALITLARTPAASA